MLTSRVSWLFRLPAMTWHTVELGNIVPTVETIPDVHLEMIWHLFGNYHNTPQTVLLLFGCSPYKLYQIYQLPNSGKSRDCPCIVVNSLHFFPSQ